MRGTQGAALSSHILCLALGVSTKLYSLTPRERPRQGLRQSVSRELFQSGESKTKEGLRAWDPARALHRDSSRPRSIKSPGDSSVGQKTIKCTQTQHSKISTTAPPKLSELAQSSHTCSLSATPGRPVPWLSSRSDEKAEIYNGCETSPKETLLQIQPQYGTK